MPVIVAANTKGGSTKSTTCLVLGTTLAAQGATVRIIDTDRPQRTVGKWSEGKSKFRDIVVEPVRDEDLTVLIDRLQSEVQFVVIDVQGSANQEIVAAMSRADLVLIPMQAKTADADEATRAIGLLRTQENLFKRKIPHAIVISRNNSAITTREEKQIRSSIDAAKIPRLAAGLNERTAFSHLIAYKLALSELNPSETNGLEEAQNNAIAFTAEVVQLLRKQQQKGSAA